MLDSVLLQIQDATHILQTLSLETALLFVRLDTGDLLVIILVTNNAPLDSMDMKVTLKEHATLHSISLALLPCSLVIQFQVLSFQYVLKLQ
jgi:hypothetical protein